MPPPWRTGRAMDDRTQPRGSPHAALAAQRTHPRGCSIKPRVDGATAQAVFAATSRHHHQCPNAAPGADTRPTIAGSDLAMSMPGGQRIWPRKGGIIRRLRAEWCGSAIEFLLNVGPGVLADFGPPAVPQPTVSRLTRGAWSGLESQEWICSSSFAGSMSSAIGTVAGVAAKFGVHRRMVRQALASALPPPRRYPQRAKPSWMRSRRSSTRFWRRICGRRASSGIRRGGSIGGS